MANYFDLRVQLAFARPPIWRRFLLRDDATFHDLHEAIQDAGGWMNGHLFSFSAKERGPTIAGIPDDSFGPPDPDARKVKLSSHFPKHEQCSYLYDFGDSWLHKVALLGVVQEDTGLRRRLEDGKRAFPPEDCGSIPGYERCVQVFSTLEDPELLDWLGDWEPEAFDLENTKEQFDR